jgi:hypothetical protein
VNAECEHLTWRHLLSHSFRPASCAMIDTQDLCHAGLNAIGNDRGRACDHQFPRAIHTSGASDVRDGRQVGLNRIENGHRQLLGSDWVVSRHVVELLHLATHALT